MHVFPFSLSMYVSLCVYLCVCICFLQETHLKQRDTYSLKVKGYKKSFQTNGDQKKQEYKYYIR